MRGLWFAQVSDVGKIIPGALGPGEYRGAIAARDLRSWTTGVGLPYHSPHKFRHGHAVYALSMARDVAALKAVSQNLMHENLTVTDGVYGILSERGVREQIIALGREAVGKKAEKLAGLGDLLGELKSALHQLELEDEA